MVRYDADGIATIKETEPTRVGTSSQYVGRRRLFKEKERKRKERSALRPPGEGRYGQAEVNEQRWSGDSELWRTASAPQHPH